MRDCGSFKEIFNCLTSKYIFMARSFNKYPFGNFKLRMNKWYRIVEVSRAIGSGGSGGKRIIITDFFFGREFPEYEKFFPEKLGSRTSYQLERAKHIPGTHIPKN